ncbi:MAG: AAA family ATPase, partial [Pseudomonadota bacterium]
MELRLGQFRSHAQAVIAADPQPVVLFGANGAGKTNILEALSLLSPGRGLRRAAAGDMARAPERIGWKIRAMVDTPGGPHEIETRAAADASRTVLLDGKPVAQTALGRVLRVLWMVPAMDRLWTEAASERRRFLDRITLSLEPAHAEVSLAYEKAMRERNRLLKDQVADPRWYAGIEAQMAKAGAEIHANRRSALTRLAAASAADSAFP